MTELKEESFSPLFGSWWDKISPFFRKGGFDPIYKELKQLSRRGKLIAPSSENTFRAFKETPYEELKAVMIGLSPYHTLRGKKIVADGLLMSSTTTGWVPPSLAKYYEGVENDMYRGQYYNKTADTSYLSHQGVLGINMALTTQIMKAGNHVDLWQPFIEYLFSEVINITGVPIICLGKEAAKVEKYIIPLYGTYIFKLTHPAFAARNEEVWDTQGCFQKVNKILMERHGTEIDWLDFGNSAPF